MAIKQKNNIDASFSMSSMTDIVFQVLLFFMISSTLVHPNALKLLLPRSNNQTSAKPITTVSITKDFQYYIEDKPVAFSQIEPMLKEKLGNNPDIYISLHADESVPIAKVVEIMNIAQRNNYKLILATRPE
jgi:biopolymer transport protein ExbD